MTSKISRRRLLTATGSAAGMLMLGGCDRISRVPWVEGVLTGPEDLDRWVQRQLQGSHALAPEYSEADLSPRFKANGSINPQTSDYQAHVRTQFTGWRLQVGGLVETPASLSLSELRAMPSRTQITRHDCVEGWSCIGKWTGVPLAALLARVGLKPDGRYVVFQCADDLGGRGQRYYESIDLLDALHPQTVLAYDMNGGPLPVAHGAPLRLRLERQLGYKMAKYIMRIEVVSALGHLGRGRGSYWADRGYEWYAGI